VNQVPKVGTGATITVILCASIDYGSGARCRSPLRRRRAEEADELVAATQGPEHGLDLLGDAAVRAISWSAVTSRRLNAMESSLALSLCT